MRTLNDLQAGESGVVADVTGEAATVERLMEMGLIEGTSVRVVKRAPLGDPLEIEARGYHLSLRAHEANGVVISPYSKPK